MYVMASCHGTIWEGQNNSLGDRHNLMTDREDATGERCNTMVDWEESTSIQDAIAIGSHLGGSVFFSRMAEQCHITWRGN